MPRTPPPPDTAAEPVAPPVKVRRTQAERTSETRRRLLDAAMDVMASKGYAGFRTAEVADAAGVSRGAMTHHFPSKDELVVALVEHVFHKASEVGRKRAHRYATPGEAIEALISDNREFFFSELFLVAMDLAIQGLMASGQQGTVRDISAASRLPVEESWVAALVDSGVPATVAEDLLWLTLSVVRGLAVRRLWQHDTERFNRLFRLWREIVETYLRHATFEDAPLEATPATPPARKRAGTRRTPEGTPSTG